MTPPKKTTPVHGPKVPIQSSPTALYHYTSFDALLSIVKSATLWATHFAFLNDESELTHLPKLVFSYLSQTRGRVRHKNRQGFIDGILDAVMEPFEDVFVASFSEVPDDLTQWRAYCPAGGGVCIGFDARAFDSRRARNVNDQGVTEMLGILEKVQYIDADWDKDLQIEVDATIADFDRFYGRGESTEMKVFSFMNWLSFFHSRFKNPAFAAEREWRLALRQSRAFEGKLPIRFRPGKSSLIPFIEIALNTGDAKDKKPYFVREVIVGPNAQQSRALHSLEALFDGFGQDTVNLNASKIPYRAVL